MRNLSDGAEATGKRQRGEMHWERRCKGKIMLLHGHDTANRVVVVSLVDRDATIRASCIEEEMRRDTHRQINGQNTGKPHNTVIHTLD